MKTLLPALLAGALLASAAPWALAEKADSRKPMNIESDTLRYEDQKQLSIFTGNVILTKGTIVMRGARLEVRQDPEGNQFATVTAEPGKRAFYRQKREGVDEFIEGEAELVEYDSKADRVRLSRRAELRRYRGTALNDEMTGSVIVYDNTVDTFAIDGQTAGLPSASAGGRVRAMLTPRPAASAASSPAAAQGQPLRPSVTLGGDRQ
jgi:lipopolysaccharide export system protein LptA